MLFRRRKPAGLYEKLRILLWPRRSFSRSLQYFGKRILRLTATPHAIAAGVAAGVVASWTPFLGLHFFIAAFLAYVMAGNIIASALGTAFGNPLTFPFIWAASYNLGNFILVEDFHEVQSDIHLGKLVGHLDRWQLWEKLLQLWEPVFKPMIIGCIPFAIVFGLAAYLLAYFSVVSYQAQRRRRMAKIRTAKSDISNGQMV